MTTVSEPPVSGLPTGTVTFLFTDIEGSTRAWERDAATMDAALARHDAVVRQAIEDHGGMVFKTVGDAFCAAFSSAPAAASAALAAQRALSDELGDDAGASRVRMAVHTGEATVRSGDYFGRAVNRVARLLAIGHGRQVLVSGASHDLIAGDPPAEATLRELGEHRLKDLERPERVWQLDHPDLPAEHPPLRSLSALPHNLPQQLTTFVGRRQEMETVEEKLAGHRLVTLTGSGGSGKTRLALQVAAEVVDAFEDGVWFVDLSALSDPALMGEAMSGALGVREVPGREPEETLLAHLRSRTLLLVLDNCEHLIDACAAFVERALRASPGLKVLATSREGLGTAGEVVWPVPTLSVPDRLDDLLPEIDRYEAVRLFAERATLVDPGFELTAEDARAVAQICRRLDGIPLAIELAAARVRVLAPQQIASRLDDRFRLLAGGRRALPRHQTLQAAIDWSHDLLEEPERILLRRLSVFAGGWDLAAAEGVTADEDGDLDALDVLDLLSRLVEKSLVVTERGEEGARYRMLETTRQYAEGRLVEAGEADAFRSRHAEWYARRAIDLVEADKAGDAHAPDELRPEVENLRAALAWLAESAEGRSTALHVASRLVGFWRRRGLLREGVDWLERLLAETEEADEPQRLTALTSLATMTWFRGDEEVSQRIARRALDMARRLGDPEQILRALRTIAMAEDDEAAIRHTEEALALADELQDRIAKGVLLVNLGERHRWLGDAERARALYREATEVHPHARPTALFNLGQMAVEAGDVDEARGRYREFAGSLVGDHTGQVYHLLGIGQLAIREGDPARGARLIGAALAEFERVGEHVDGADTRVLERSLAAGREALGDEALEAELARGRATPFERARVEARDA